MYNGDTTNRLARKESGIVENAKLLLEYFDVLAWPVLVLVFGILSIWNFGEEIRAQIRNLKEVSFLGVKLAWVIGRDPEILPLRDEKDPHKIVPDAWQIAIVNEQTEQPLVVNFTGDSALQMAMAYKTWLERSRT